MNGDAGVWLRLVVGVFATWRVTHLLVHEDGPGDLIARARALLGAGRWGRMADCFHCMSLWVAAPVALWVAAWTADAWWVALALSGAACLCERAGQRDVVMQPWPEANEGERDGMLRTKT